LKTYKSHKIVEAGVIKAIVQHEAWSRAVDIDLQCGATHQLDKKALERYAAQPGDYLVKYSDGYLAVSPKKAFEEGYTEITGTDHAADLLVEQEIQEKGLTAPRVTPDQIESLMAGVEYHTHVVPGTTTTIATAIAENGFTLATGKSACASPENFDAELGRKVAIQNAEKAARDTLWELEGWRLKMGALPPAQ